MKAAVLYETNKPLVIEDVDIDAPKAYEVKVKLAVAGVCRSDLHFMKGEANETFAEGARHLIAGLDASLEHAPAELVKKEARG